MGAPVVGGVLGAANVIGGVVSGGSQRAAQNAQAKQNAQALQASLLLERQRVIDQSAIEEMQLKLAKQFAMQQSSMGQLQRQSEQQAFDASQKLMSLQDQMAVAQGSMQNEAGLANAKINETNIKGQASQRRFSAETQALEGQSQAAQLQRGVAEQNQQAVQGAHQQFKQSELARDTSFALDPNSDAANAARMASMRDSFTGAMDVSRKADVRTDEVAVQAEYIKKITQTLRNMGISEADAMEAAAAVTTGIAQAGYDLNSINLEGALALGNQERSIQGTAFYANQDQQKRAAEMDFGAQMTSLNTAETVSMNNRNSALVGIQEQARTGTQFGASSPSALGTAAQVASGMYGVYQQFKTPSYSQPQQQSQFGISRVAMPSLLSPSPYQYPTSATYSIQR